MSRSGYSEDCEYLELYRGTVDRAIAGKRGQKFLRELVQALDELPEKILIVEELVNETGECCALGAVCQRKAIDTSHLDPYDSEAMGQALNIAPQMAAEIAYENDEACWRPESPEERWLRMRKWAEQKIKS